MGRWESLTCPSEGWKESSGLDVGAAAENPEAGGEIHDEGPRFSLWLSSYCLSD